MKIELNNIGIVEKASIVLNGLTVIAGENDSGKSTVGKVLYALIKTVKWSSNIHDSQDAQQVYIDKFNNYIKRLFNKQISADGDISFLYDNYDFKLKISKHKCIEFKFSDEYKNNDPKVLTPLLIDSPYIWNILPSLKTITAIEANKMLGNEIDFEMLETIKDLYLAFVIKSKDDNKIKLESLPSIIGGKFKDKGSSEYIFQKDNENIEIVNTAFGIKYFGILQILSDNNHLYAGQILILDEPEVHLHPKWQLELARVVVSLVEQGVKIIVNSHSPYMIEALQRFSKQRKIPHNFYLAQGHKIVEDDQALSKIFAKLSEPFEVFDSMDSETLNG